MESWLCQIAKNIYYSYLRKKKGQEPAERECAEHDFVHKLEEKDTAKAVLKVLHELPEPYREVFYLQSGRARIPFYSRLESIFHAGLPLQTYPARYLL